MDSSGWRMEMDTVHIDQSSSILRHRISTLRG